MSGAGRMYGGFVQVERAGVLLLSFELTIVRRGRNDSGLVYDIGRLQKVNEQQCGWEATFQSCNDSVVMSWRRGWSLFWWRGSCGRGKEGSGGLPASSTLSIFSASLLTLNH